jgi:hypothetical protein
MDRVGDEDAAEIGQGFDARGDVDTVAIEVVALDDHIAEIDADAQFDMAIRPRHQRCGRASPAAPRLRSAPHRRRWQTPPERRRRWS